MTEEIPPHAERRLYLIDGSGFIFRAFHALPPMTRADGTPVNAVLGFTNMLLKLLTDFHAGQVAIIFDAARGNFRHEIYPEYKANRSEPPDELIPQFGLIREAVAAFSLPSIELEGFEADDLIATYACLARDRGQEVTIVSSDKDLMQLVREGVDMFDPIKNRVIGRAEVIEKFGVPPEQMIDLQAMVGDSVDNVPGIPGIGPKTAAQLLGEFGTLENLLANAATIKQDKRRETIIENADKARLSKTLVRLDCSVPVPVALEALEVRPFDLERLSAFCRSQGFRSVIGRLESLTGSHRFEPDPTHGTEAEIIPVGPAETASIVVDYRLLQDEVSLVEFLAQARESGFLALHCCRAAYGELAGIAMVAVPGKACYLPLTHLAENAAAEGSLDFAAVASIPQLGLAQVARLLGPLLVEPGILKIGHDLKGELPLLEGFAEAGKISSVDDTQLLSYALDGTSHGHELEELAELFLSHHLPALASVVGSGRTKIGFERVPLEGALAYAAARADMILRLHKLLRRRLVPERMMTLYETIDRPLITVCRRMEQTGILVDRAALAGLSQRFGAKLAELEAGIHEKAGRAFNIGSPKQLGEVLFGELNLAGGKRSKTGDWSTDVHQLEPLAGANPIVQAVLDWRQVSKLKTTYTDALQAEIDPVTGRVHTRYMLAATSTGRLSSTEPNLQNIPIRREEGREIRRAFIAEAGYKLLSIDYSQIELRLAAEIAGIAALVEAFRNGHDIHALTASQVFGIPLAEMTADLRRAAKAINFGIIYGISGFGLGQQLGIGAAEANTYIKQYLDRFSELRVYMEETKHAARASGYVETLAGRKCFIPGINDKNPARRSGAERQAINARLQGTAADIMRKAMVKVAVVIEQKKLPARLLLQVHDELVLEVPETAVEDIAAQLKNVMANVVQLGVPLEVEAGAGQSWAAAH